ncbi:S41 family peptidase [Flavobacterium sp. FBOR7N2.3]|uniref:S41 family peptidase n=1 Tax=Flavobacterium magnesitis TaxID=3138077 RepID=A0ABV4TLA1_9FLAO
MKSTYHYLFLLLLPLLFLQSCQDQDDTLPEPTPLDVPKFIWRGINSMYLWQAEVPDLADKRFTSNAEYESFLNNFSSPENVFENLLHRPPSLYETNVVDQFSWMVSDYLTLEQQLGGTTKNNGVEYGLSLVNTDKVIGYVRYIIPNSDASNKNIKRGEVFYAVNGTSLTLTNYRSLLNSPNENYTLNFADLTYDANNNPVITPNGKSVDLTKTSLAENPVFIKKVINSGAHKIGYLMYNGFYPVYDAELNDAFGYFKSEGVTELVLDLRYNGGGSVLTATRLASMITGQFRGELFSELAYNDKKSYLNRKYTFTSTIDGTSLNSLNLNTVYVLTTRSTASASELIINGLDPYINVIQIGDATYGKDVASVTLYDSPGFTKKNVNPSHRYAMQLIVAHSINSVGFGDYLDGLEPEHKLLERVQTLGVLGNTDEPLLNTAIGKITGTARMIPEKSLENLEYLNDSKTLRGQNQMYFE